LSTADTVRIGRGESPCYKAILRDNKLSQKFAKLLLLRL
jgi:hypothetical protein